MRLVDAAGVADYRAMARRRLPRFLFDYFDGAAIAEGTAARNRHDLDALAIEQRVMVDVGTVDPSTTILGKRWSMPVALGPVGLAGLAARRGEVQAAIAARAAGLPFCLSTYGLSAFDEVDRATEGQWFQLYVLRDRGFTSDLLERVEALRPPVLVLTVDTPVSGVRYRDRRSGLNAGTTLPGKVRQAIQAAAHPRWLYDVALRGRPLLFGSIAPAVPSASGLGDFWAWLGANLEPRLTWADVDFVRQRFSGRIVVKGVMDPRDADAAIDAGVDGIIVSNHGGRQLDGARSSIVALPGVVAAAAGRVPVMMDGGIRSGVDVVKALDQGATACLLGRAWVFALAAGGRAGVAQLLADLQREIVVTLALSGRTTVPLHQAGTSK